MSSYILIIDQGTTGTRAIIFDEGANPISQSYRQLNQYYPEPGWVEQDAKEIWQSTLSVIKGVIEKSKISPSKIEAVGITNQRETTLFWDKNTGEPLGRAIVWQCRRTVDICEKWKKQGFEKIVKKKTGLFLDPYFSASKIRWAIDNIPSFDFLISQGKILFGTVETYLIFKLTGGKKHLTDYTNASRTMLFNIHRLKWDRELLSMFGIPENILPQPLPSRSIFGKTEKVPFLPSGIPIAAAVGDQQASLFGHGCTLYGDTKITYGTGCFLLVNTGERLFDSPNLITTLACDSKGMPCYALEGSIFIAGAAIQWLKEGLQVVSDPSQTAEMAQRIKDTGGVYFVPAFVGLGAPYWNPKVKGAILGITRGTKKEHIVRASLEAIAYQVKDLVGVVEDTMKFKIKRLRVDGGVSRNDFLMQFQSDILGVPVEKAPYSETTAFGTALVAGLTTGLWSEEKIKFFLKKGKVFSPKMDEEKAKFLYQGWKKALLLLTGKA